MTYQGAAFVQRFLGPEMWKVWRKSRRQAPRLPQNLPNPLRSKTIFPDPEASKAGLCEASELIPDNSQKTWMPESGWWCLANMGNAIREHSLVPDTWEMPLWLQKARGRWHPPPGAPGTPDNWGLVSLVLICSLGPLGHASPGILSSSLNMTQNRLTHEWNGNRAVWWFNGWVQVSALPHTSCKTWSHSLYLSVPWFSQV